MLFQVWCAYPPLVTSSTILTYLHNILCIFKTKEVVCLCNLQVKVVLSWSWGIKLICNAKFCLCCLLTSTAYFLVNGQWLTKIINRKYRMHVSYVCKGKGIKHNKRNDEEQQFMFLNDRIISNQFYSLWLHRSCTWKVHNFEWHCNFST